MIDDTQMDPMMEGEEETSVPMPEEGAPEELPEEAPEEETGEEEAA